MNRPALLDVNLLVALFDPDHVHHDLAHDWFTDNRGRGWATCSTTENGFVRIVANPAYGSEVRRPADLIGMLKRMCGSKGHRFWEETVSFRDETLFDSGRLANHRQVTDVYLLGLAQRHGGCLATFDRTIPVAAIVGARRDVLEVIAPVDSQ
jgi:toxin-antitoxin system PIN domain toxin